MIAAIKHAWAKLSLACLLLACFLVFNVSLVHAQATSPGGALTSSIKTGVEPLTVMLTGTFTNAYNCVASGATGFTGARGSGGTVSINESVTLKAGEIPTLTCDGRGFAKLDWTAPTKNADDSALTDLYAFEIFQGTDPANLTSALTVSPTAITKTLTGVVRGTYFYGVKALAGTLSASRASALSNVASKTVVPPVLAFAADVVVTKPPTIPNPPTNVTVAQEQWEGLDQSLAFKLTSSNKRVPEVIGAVPLGTECAGNVVFYFRDQPYRKVPASKVAWWNGIAPANNVAAFCKATPSTSNNS